MAQQALELVHQLGVGLHLAKREEDAHVFGAIGDGVEGAQHLKQIAAIDGQEDRARQRVPDLRLDHVRLVLQMADRLRNLTNSFVIAVDEGIE